jgi:hypothetical protein
MLNGTLESWYLKNKHRLRVPFLQVTHTKGTFNLVTTYRLEESQIDRPHTWVHFEWLRVCIFKMNPRVWTVDL